MRDILNDYLNVRNGERSVLSQRTDCMPRQGGRVICESLMSLKLEIKESNSLSPDQKEELQAAIEKLWLAKECNKMSIDNIS